jgi:hypothetical protein
LQDPVAVLAGIRSHGRPRSLSGELSDYVSSGDVST